MFCSRCGTENSHENKFCRGCGAAIGTAGAAQSAAAGQAGPAPQAYPQAQAYGQAPAQGPPPGMVAMLYQAYPGGPQQVYYVPASGAQAQGGAGFMDGIRSKIREIASTDKLEGFSLGDLFKETFTRRGADAMGEYLAAGSSLTTPPLEVVETGWPRPWMFFRVLAALAIAYAVYYALFLFSLNEKVLVGVMVLATFAVPVATMTLLWEMNTPRNVSIAKVLEVFVIGGGISVVVATLWYLIPIFGNLPGVVEETSKLFAVVVVTYSARGSRYPYQLNGILFGAAVGAGFACSETLGYGLDAVLQFLREGGLQELVAANPNLTVPALLASLLKTVMTELNLRAILSPFGHPMFTAISAGALFRVKGDRTFNLGMLADGRFLRAFLIPVVLHEIWDSPLAAGNSNVIVQYVGEIAVALVGWYVVFTMIQQGLHQVRDMQKAQLQHTLAHVEAMQPQ
jgi:RsiW-degrading membrane proteinase PrsW (M82 family)